MATERLTRVNFDLLGLTVRRVEVNDGLARFERKAAHELVTSKVVVGDHFKTVVTYDGKPTRDHAQIPSGWFDATTPGAGFIAGEPHSCTVWFPCNDHPTDKAAFWRSATVPTPLKVVSVGRQGKTTGGLVAHRFQSATVLIETITAAFEMDEILYELREHAADLNAGRWDYLFSLIKNFRDAGNSFVLPDRAAVTMTAPFLRAYSDLLVKTCHRRGAFAMGGMAAFIPSRRDLEVNAVAIDKVRADKEREAGDGYDGSWVAHPDLVPVCLEAFDAVLGDKPNQLDRQRDDVTVSAGQLLDVSATGGEVTAAGVRSNVSVAIRYLVSWLNGAGAAAIDNLMEDAATAEISRSQLWQWTHQGITMSDGVSISADYVRSVVGEVAGELRQAIAVDDAALAQLDRATQLFQQVALDDEFVDFLTLPAYERYVD
ncbi:MAG: hypothetical protein WKF82_03335 [Nocardioidaceae bacterium]